jgi:hypothetical protein
MKTTTKRLNETVQSSREGSALIVVMYVCMLLAVVTAVGWKLAGTSTIRTRRYADHSRALALAEAGVARMYEYLAADPAGWTDKSYTNAVGPGFYVVEANRVSPTLIHIVSTGTVEEMHASTAFEVITADYGTLTGNMVFSGEFGIVADGDITLDTTAMDIHGAVHANGMIRNHSGNPRVHGDLSACGAVQVAPQDGYQAIPNAPKVVIPDHDTFEPWRELAQNGGIYVSGNYTIGKTEIRPGNGVLFVDGNILIRNRSSFVGTMVATGSVTIENKFNQTRTNTEWPCMLAGGDIELFNRNNYDGAFYTCGNFTSFNNKLIQGPIVALGNVEIRNNADVVPYAGPTKIDPNQQWIASVDVDKGGWIR